MKNIYDTQSELFEFKVKGTNNSTIGTFCAKIKRGKIVLEYSENLIKTEGLWGESVFISKQKK